MPSFARTITAVETAVPASLEVAFVLQPVVVHSAGEFEQLFGDGSAATTHDELARRAVLEAGFAPLRPEEFMVMRIRIPTA